MISLAKIVTAFLLIANILEYSHENPLFTCKNLKSLSYEHEIKCPKRVVRYEKRFTFYSTQREDIYAYLTFFRNKTQGTFLELGAVDGVALSNTKFFEDYRGWRGVLIEANPVNTKRLCRHRPCSYGVRAAVCNIPHQVHYVVPVYQKRNKLHSGGVLCYSGVGGIWEFMDHEFRKQWYNSKVYMARNYSVDCYPLSSILQQLEITKIDFLSLDVEGGEFAVLQTLDFSRVEIDVLVVEIDKQKDHNVEKLVMSKGYHLHGIIGPNAWFVRKGSEYLPYTSESYVQQSNEMYSSQRKEKFECPKEYTKLRSQDEEQ